MYSHQKGGWTNRDPDPASVAPVGDIRAWDGSYPEPVRGERYRMSGFGTTEKTAIYGAPRFQMMHRLKPIAVRTLSRWTHDAEEGTSRPGTERVAQQTSYTQ